MAPKLRSLWKLLSTRRLLLATPVVVLAFVAAHMITAHEEKRIDSDSAGIAASTSPATQRLMEVESTLREMGQLVASVTLDERGAEEPRPRVAFKEYDAALHRQIAEYLLVPSFPAAQKLWLELDHSVDELVRTFDRMLELAETGEKARARDLLRNELRPQRARAYAAIAVLINLNAGESARLSDDIRSIRERVAIEWYVLQGLALLVAALVVGLAWRGLRAQARLAEERRRLAEERANEMELFAGRVAHDLKSPLGAMLFRVGLAARKSGDETYTRLSQQIQSMARVIDGLLEFALSGARPEPGARARLADVLADVVAALREETGAADVEIATTAPPDLEVGCSPGALSSVLRNLMLNSVKFMDGRTVRRIAVRAFAAEGDRVRIEIEDTGPGVPAGQESAIFEPYVRLAATRRQPGLGLGLATVKRIVEAYGGTVGVRPGEGACFWLELPRAMVAEPRAQGSQQPWVH